MSSRAYINLARRESVHFADAMIDEISDPRLENDSGHFLVALVPRKHRYNSLQVLRSRTRLLHNPLVITILFLMMLCIFLGFWIVCLSEGLHRLPGDHYDKLFDASNTGDSQLLLWDSEHQSFIREVYPVPIHSHNDYMRRIPLFEALGSGCISVEADVHLRDSDLLVVHKASQLNPGSNLRIMYLDPLEHILRARNANRTTSNQHGIFNRTVHQTLVLLVDLKTKGAETLTMLSSHLQPLRDLGYLTYQNGTARTLRPLTVVVTGNAPFSNSNTYRDIFQDADLDRLVLEHDTTNHFQYNASNSYYASARQSDSLSRDVRTASQGKIAMQIEHARVRGLVARYWDTLAQPPNMRDLVWRALIENGIGILNINDIGIVRDRAKGQGNLAT